LLTRKASSRRPAIAAPTSCSLAPEISDHGPGLDDPLAGYLPPHPGHARGAGLWVARQMTRRLAMTSSSRGLTTRLWT
jgi:hypothetical protein